MEGIPYGLLNEVDFLLVIQKNLIQKLDKTGARGTRIIIVREKVGREDIRGMNDKLCFSQIIQAVLQSQKVDLIISSLIAGNESVPDGIMNQL